MHVFGHTFDNGVWRNTKMRQKNQTGKSFQFADKIAQVRAN